MFVCGTQTGEVIAVDSLLGIIVFSFVRDDSGELYVMGNRNAITTGETSGAFIKIEPIQVLNTQQTCFSIPNKRGQFITVCF